MMTIMREKNDMEISTNDKIKIKERKRKKVGFWKIWFKGVIIFRIKIMGISTQFELLYLCPVINSLEFSNIFFVFLNFTT